VSEAHLPRGEGAADLRERGHYLNPVGQRKPRRDMRVQTNLPVTLIVKSEGAESMQAAFAANISVRGLRISTRSGLDPGQ